MILRISQATPPHPARQALARGDAGDEPNGHFSRRIRRSYPRKRFRYAPAVGVLAIRGGVIEIPTGSYGRGEVL